MEFNDQQPIYQQIQQVLADRIIRGELQPGDQLPPVRQLALDLTVNVNTVQRALAAMIQDGIVTTQRGRGNFVTADPQVVARLTEASVQRAVSTLCDTLTALGLSPAAIREAVDHYLTERKPDHD